MRFSDLLRRKVVSESGLGHGRVQDIRGELEDGRLRVTGLACGSLGLLERYGVGTGGTGGANEAKVHGHPAIPWERVVRVGSEIVVRD
jgi:sporulation protein YlmC with PRC-barrel domain